MIEMVAWSTFAIAVATIAYALIVKKTLNVMRRHSGQMNEQIITLQGLLENQKEQIQKQAVHYEDTKKYFEKDIRVKNKQISEASKNHRDIVKFSEKVYAVLEKYAEALLDTVREINEKVESNDTSFNVNSIMENSLNRIGDEPISLSDGLQATPRSLTGDIFNTEFPGISVKGIGSFPFENPYNKNPLFATSIQDAFEGKPLPSTGFSLIVDGPKKFSWETEKSVVGEGPQYYEDEEETTAVVSDESDD